MTDKKIYNGFEFFDKLRERLYNDEKVIKAGKGLKLNDVNTMSVNNGDGITFDDEGKVTVNGEELLATEEQAGTVYITETPDEWHDKDPDKIALNVVGFNKEKASLVHTINNVKTKLESLLQIKKAGSGLEFDEESNTLSVNVGEGLEFDEEGKLETKIATTETIGSVYLTDTTIGTSAGMALSQLAGRRLTSTLKERDISEVSEGLVLTVSENATGKLLTLNTATDTTLGGVKVSNAIGVEEPADNLVPNVVAIQDELLNNIYPVFEYIPKTYSNGLIFNQDEYDLRIELGNGLKVNDSGALSVVYGINENLPVTGKSTFNELVTLINPSYIDVYGKYTYATPETGNQVIFEVGESALDKYDVSPYSPSYDQYVGSCVVRHNDTESLELMRYSFVHRSLGKLYQFTIKPDNVTDGDLVAFHIHYPIMKNS